MQEGASVKMADQLESLAAHYDQMLVAMTDHDAGETFSEQDIQGECISTLSIIVVYLLTTHRDEQRYPGTSCNYC